jgi:hypothetical protein
VVAHHLVVLVEPVEPVGDRAEAALEEARAQAREPLEHAAVDHVHHHRHLSERVRDHVLHEQVVVVAADREARHARTTRPFSPSRASRIASATARSTSWSGTIPIANRREGLSLQKSLIQSL